MNVEFNEKEMQMLLDGLYNLEIDLESRIDDIREELKDCKYKRVNSEYSYKELNASLNRVKKIKDLENKIMEF